MQGNYCAYLRKSRKDLEAEARGEGETLARHEHILLDLAHRMNISLEAIYKEVVSGETISARPVMQQLLREVEEGMWTGVLVVEIERLARGDTRDQGYVAEAFTYSDTKIITPLKTYDPADPADQEYFEFNLFMSRREYKTINRRLETGRHQSFLEGKFLGNIAPYGWERYKLERHTDPTGPPWGRIRLPACSTAWGFSHAPVLAGPVPQSVELLRTNITLAWCAADTGRLSKKCRTGIL